MKKLSLVLKCMAAGGMALAVAQATAAPVIGYDVNDQAANGVIPVGSAFSTVRAGFEATLDTPGIRRETLGASNVPAGASLSVLGGTATITQSDLLVVNPNPPFTPLNFGLRGSVKSAAAAGRYNTTGNGAGNQSPTGAWFESDGIFSLNLDNKYQAFAFDATDFSDFDGVLTMTLFNGAQQGEILTLARPVGSLVANGSVLFYGFSSAIDFDRILFSIAQVTPRDVSSYDVIGFDQITVGRLASTSPPGTVPEPGTLALVGLALAGLGVRSRARAA